MKNLILYIIAVNQSTGDILNYDKNKIGNHLSSTTQLDINQITNNTGVDDLTVVYDEKTFNHTDLKMLANYILSINPKYDSGRDEDIVISTSYIYNKQCPKNKYTIHNIKEIDKLLVEGIYEIDSKGKTYIDIDGEHHKSGYVKEFNNDDEVDDEDVSSLLDQVLMYASNEEYDDEEEIDIGVSSENIYQPLITNFNPETMNEDREVLSAGYNILDNVMGYGTETGIRYNNDNSIPEDYDDFDIKNYNKKYGDDDYGYIPMSKSLAKSVNTKHNIKNYNMLFVKNKKAVLEDYKTIMKFLKEFLPGNSKWIKEYRKEVAAKWIFSLVRTYKQVKKMGKLQEKEEKDNNDKKFRKGIKRITKAFMPLLKG